MLFFLRAISLGMVKVLSSNININITCTFGKKDNISVYWLARSLPTNTQIDILLLLYLAIYTFIVKLFKIQSNFIINFPLTLIYFFFFFGKHMSHLKDSRAGQAGRTCSIQFIFQIQIASF